MDFRDYVVAILAVVLICKSYSGGYYEQSYKDLKTTITGLKTQKKRLEACVRDFGVDDSMCLYLGYEIFETIDAAN